MGAGQLSLCSQRSISNSGGQKAPPSPAPPPPRFPNDFLRTSSFDDRMTGILKKSRGRREQRGCSAIGRGGQTFCPGRSSFWPGRSNFLVGPVKLTGPGPQQSYRPGAEIIPRASLSPPRLVQAGLLSHSAPRILRPVRLRPLSLQPPFSHPQTEIVKKI